MKKRFKKPDLRNFLKPNKTPKQITTNVAQNERALKKIRSQIKNPKGVNTDTLLNQTKEVVGNLFGMWDEMKTMINRLSEKPHKRRDLEESIESEDRDL